MAKTNRKSPTTVVRLHPESSLLSRAADVEHPSRHAVVAIRMFPEITVQCHTLGTDKLWSVPVREAASNDRLISGMSPEDALYVGIWYGEAKIKALYRELAAHQPQTRAAQK